MFKTTERFPNFSFFTKKNFRVNINFKEERRYSNSNLSTQKNWKLRKASFVNLAVTYEGFTLKGILAGEESREPATLNFARDVVEWRII